jgi:hypothetical protein
MTGRELRSRERLGDLHPSPDGLEPAVTAGITKLADVISAGMGEPAEKQVTDEHRNKVTPVWNPDDLALAVRSLFEPGTPAKYIGMPKARYAFFQVDKVLRNGSTIGLSHRRSRWACQG